MTYGEFFRERLAPSVIDYIVQTKHHNRRMPQAGTAEEIGELFVANYTVSHGFQTESPGQGSWQQGNDAHAGGQASTALGNAARALGQRSVAVGSGSVAIDDDTLSVGNVDMKRRITHVADGQSNSDAVNLGQFNRILDASRHEAAQQANRYTDQRVGELRKTVEQLDKTFRQGIASSAALQMVMPYAPGRVAVNAGTAMYRGQAAVAAGVSWWHPSGNVNFNGGISTAGGTSTILRAGIGYLF